MIVHISGDSVEDSVPDTDAAEDTHRRKNVLVLKLIKLGVAWVMIL